MTIGTRDRVYNESIWKELRLEEIELEKAKQKKLRCIDSIRGQYTNNSLIGLGLFGSGIPDASVGCGVMWGRIFARARELQTRTNPPRYVAITRYGHDTSNPEKDRYYWYARFYRKNKQK